MLTYKRPPNGLDFDIQTKSVNHAIALQDPLRRICGGISAYHGSIVSRKKISHTKNIEIRVNGELYLVDLSY